MKLRDMERLGRSEVWERWGWGHDLKDRPGVFHGSWGGYDVFVGVTETQGWTCEVCWEATGDPVCRTFADGARAALRMACEEMGWPV